MMSTQRKGNSMKRSIAFSLCFLGMLASSASAELTLFFPPLAKPLKLPPGNVMTLPINNDTSMFGDALRAVDCTNDADLPYGICGNQLFGGLVMTDSHLKGNITVQFFPTSPGLAHFVVNVHQLAGEDGVLSAPLGFSMPVKSQSVSDSVKLSSGDLNLLTGEVFNLEFNVSFVNSALFAIANVNPKLKSPIITFPGVRGHAWASFRQRGDGLLDFRFRGETFLPLGREIEGDPVRFPLPHCGPEGQCASVLARGTSLHPHLYLDTQPPSGTPCGANCPDLPTDRQQEFAVSSFFTNFGDNFEIDNPGLGGVGPGRSHLQGRLGVQFGPRAGNTISFTQALLLPGGLFATPPVSTITGPGFQPGFVGQNEFLPFPNVTYYLQRVAMVDEPYGLLHGAIDVRTGEVIGEMEYPMFLNTAVAEVLFRQNAGRVSLDPFFVIAGKPIEDHAPEFYALFQKGVNGETMFRFNGQHRRSFATFRFPGPDFQFVNSFIGGPKANLDIFIRIQAAHTTDTPTAIKTGSGSFVSSIKDNVSYNFAIPCNPVGAPFTFSYTNGNSGASGGTFTMKSLAYVSCSNSRLSTAKPGDYDTISINGFGTWSKDASDALPRLATVNISLAPGAPYFGILVYQNPDANQTLVVSTANNKPTDVLEP
ncbi:MAG: hypothetical protein JWN34_4770 [Bryobacterales bacterium]|nr:hypothetical protein [Bryobacterales bacterium]